MNEETAGGSKQNKRNTRSKSKIKNLSLQEQVTPIKVMAEIQFKSTWSTDRCGKGESDSLHEQFGEGVV